MNPFASDPFRAADPFHAFPHQRFPQPPEEPGLNTPLSPEDQEAFLRQEQPEKWYAGPLKALKFAGDTLSKVARPVRTGIADISNLFSKDKIQTHPSEYLAFIPFSDTAGWTNPENQITAEQQLPQWGIEMDKDHPFWSWDTLKSLAYDIFTDPVSYATLGGGGVVTTGAKEGSKAVARQAPSLLTRVGSRLPFVGEGIASRAEMKALQQAGKPLMTEVGTATRHLPLTEAGEVLSRNKLLPKSAGTRLAGFTSEEQRLAEIGQLAANPATSAADRAVLNDIIAGAQSGQGVPLEAVAQMRVGLPLGIGPSLGSFNLGTTWPGRIATQAAFFPFGGLPTGSTLRLGDFWRQYGHHIPGVTTGRALFSKGESGDQATHLGQEISRTMHQPELRAAEQRLGQHVPQFEQNVAEAGLEDLLGNDPAMMRELSAHLENTVAPAAADPALQRAAQELNAAKDRAFEAYINKGGRVEPLAPRPDMMTHSPRYANQVEPPVGGWESVGHGPTGPGGVVASRRVDTSRNVFNDMFADPVLRGAGPADDATRLAHVLNNYMMPGAAGAPATARTVVGGVPSVQHAEDLVQLLKTANAAETAAFFKNHPLQDMKQYMQSMAKNDALAETIHKQLALGSIADNAWQDAVARGVNLGERIQVSEALKRLGLDGEHAADRLAAQAAGTPYFGRGLEYQARKQTDLLGRAVSPAELQQRFISDEQFKALENLANPKASWTSTLDKVPLFDTFSNLFKGWQTILWPAHLIQNWMGGIWQNIITGTSNPKNYLNAERTLTGKVVPGLARTAEYARYATDEEATKAMVRQLAAGNLLQRSGSFQGELTGPGVQKAVADSLALPGVHGLGEQFFGHEPLFTRRAINPLDFRGVPSGLVTGEGRKTTGFLPARIGEGIAEMSDRINRVAHYLGRIEEGLTHEGALASTMATHMDYRNLTNFERNLMRRLFPFYNYMRQNAPQQVRQFVQFPNRQMPAVRLMQEAQARPTEEGETAYIPEYLRGSAVLPFGKSIKEENIFSGRPIESQKYLQLPSLPPEDALRYLQMRRDPITGETHLDRGKVLRNLASQLDPLVKLAAEKLTGEDLRTGAQKELELGARWYEKPEYKWLTEAAEYSPAARAVQTWNRLAPLLPEWARLKHQTDQSHLEPWQMIASEAAPFVRWKEADVEKAKRLDLQRALESEVEQVPGVKRRGDEWYVPEESQNYLTMEPNPFMPQRVADHYVNVMRAYAGSRKDAELASLYRKVENAEAAKADLDALLQKQAASGLSSGEVKRAFDLANAVALQDEWLAKAEQMEIAKEMRANTGERRVKNPGLQMRSRQLGKQIRMEKRDIRQNPPMP